MGIYYALAALGIVAAVLGVAFAKIRHSIKWHILSVAGISVATVFAVIIICFYTATNTSDSEYIKALSYDDWRSDGEYTQDYKIADGITVCAAILDDGSGFGVYDCKTGERVGSLLWESDKTVINTDKAFELNDLNADGYNDIGVYTQSGDILYYTYSPDKEYSKKNVTGCFEQAYTEYLKS